MPRLLTVDEAQRAVLASVRPLETEIVPLAEASGRVLAADALARTDLPPFPSSAMDGFALRAADAPGELPVTERVAAGRPAPRALEAVEAFAIATGGVVPVGADVVVPVENCEQLEARVRVPAVVAGDNIRPRGGDIRAGDVVVARGTLLRAQQLGALAAAGVPELECARRPRVAVLATGTELRAPGEELEPGQVYEANGLLLSTALRACGAEVERLAAVADDPDEHRQALEHALDADVVVTSGGVSVGPHDLVRGIGASLGVEERFWRVAVKPGKPVWFGVRGRTLVFGLPGNPVSSFVGCELFVKPALRALQGLRDPLPPLEPARLGRAVRRNPHRDEYVRASRSVDGDATTVEPLTGQDSHMIARAAAADALVLVPAGDGELAAGASVRFLPL